MFVACCGYTKAWEEVLVKEVDKEPRITGPMQACDHVT